MKDQITFALLQPVFSLGRDTLALLNLLRQNQLSLLIRDDFWHNSSVLRVGWTSTYGIPPIDKNL
jgi:hypothetical protein